MLLLIDLSSIWLEYFNSVLLPLSDFCVSFWQSEAGVKEFHMVQVSSSSKHWQLHKSVNISENKGLYLEPHTGFY